MGVFKRNFDKFIYYFKRYGFFNTVKKCFSRIFKNKNNFEKINADRYVSWMIKNNLTNEEIEAQRIYKFEKNPKISVVVPMYNTNENYFKDLVEYMRLQTYINWELCLADGSEVENKELKKYIEIDTRIKYKFLNGNKGIAENTNKAIEMATGEFIGFLDHDDLLSVDCLFEIVKAINENPEVDFIYTDEDKIADDMIRSNPYFKPDFSKETLECNNYITHFSVVKSKLLKKVGGLRKEFNGAQDFDLILRITNEAKNIVHIPKILYHWRMAQNSTARVADSKPYAYEAGRRVVEDYLKANNKKAIVEFGNDVPGIYKITYDVIGNPKVSIVIPNKDNKKLLKRCINSILELTTYENYEIIIVENNSEEKEIFDYYEELSKNEKIKIIKYKGEFNYSKIINEGVKNSKGEYILQLNNDTKLITKNWLEIFIGYAQNKQIGAIGGRLYYEDMTIQHAGIAYGIAGTAGNLLVNLPYNEHAYYGREAATRNVSCVTGACLFARKELYEEVGFMEEKLEVAFNDVDFCLKIMEKGYRNLYIPYIELIHYESKTRGYEDTEEKKKRFEKEEKYFKEKWKELLENKPDPYYNINFSREFCNFVITEDKVK